MHPKDAVLLANASYVWKHKEKWKQRPVFTEYIKCVQRY